MHQAFNARFQFHKRSVGNQIDDLAFDFGADRVLLFDTIPRVRELLLETEADALLFPIDIQDNNIDILANFEQFGRVTNAPPAHIGDVQQSVDAVQIDERAKI